MSRAVPFAVAMLLLVIGRASGSEVSPVVIDPVTGVALGAAAAGRPFVVAILPAGQAAEVVYGGGDDRITVRLLPATRAGLGDADALIGDLAGGAVDVFAESRPVPTITAGPIESEGAGRWRRTTVRYDRLEFVPHHHLTLRLGPAIMLITGADPRLQGEEVRSWAFARLQDVRGAEARERHPATGVSYPAELAGYGRDGCAIEEDGNVCRMVFSRGRRRFQAVLRLLSEEEKGIPDGAARWGMIVGRELGHLDRTTIRALGAVAPRLQAHWDEDPLDGRPLHWATVEGLQQPGELDHLLLSTDGTVLVGVRSRDTDLLKQEELRRGLVGLLPSSDVVRGGGGGPAAPCNGTPPGCRGG